MDAHTKDLIARIGVLEEALAAMIEVAERESPSIHRKILEKLLEVAIWHEADAHDLEVEDVVAEPFKPKSPVAKGLNAIRMSAMPASENGG